MGISEIKVYDKRQKGQARSIFVVLAAASALAAFAVYGPVNADETASASGSDTVAASLEDRKADARKRGYRLVVKKGLEFYCKREAVTGSRLVKGEVCLTQDQMDRLRENSQEFLQDAQNPPQDPPRVDNMGGPGT